MKKFVGYLLGIVGLFLPSIAMGDASFPFWGPLVPCQGSCTSLCQLFVLAQNLINFGLTVLLIVIGPIAVVFGGIMILVSAGNPDRISTGKRILTGAIIGIAIGLASFVIVNTFLGLIGATVGSGGVGWGVIQCSP